MRVDVSDERYQRRSRVDPSRSERRRSRTRSPRRSRSPSRAGREEARVKKRTLYKYGERPASPPLPPPSTATRARSPIQSYARSKRLEGDEVRSRSRSRSPPRRRAYSPPDVRSPARRQRRLSYSPSRSRSHSKERTRVRSPPPISRTKADNSPKRRRGNSASPPPPPYQSDRRRRHARSRSPDHKRRRRSYSRSRSRSPRRAMAEAPQAGYVRSRQPLPSQIESFGGEPSTGPLDKPVEKEKPNFKPSGLLAAESNKVKVHQTITNKLGQVRTEETSIIMKYKEPPEARPAHAGENWVMFVFKGDSQQELEKHRLHERSHWLMGRESVIADVLVEHPSCSKQHAILQFRFVEKKSKQAQDAWGLVEEGAEKKKKGKVQLYLLDLESSNGTMLNGERIEAARYVQVLSGDVIKLGESTREYVVVRESKR